MVGKETTIYNSLDFHMQSLRHCNVNYVQQGNALLLKASHSIDYHMNQTKQIPCTSPRRISLIDSMEVNDKILLFFQWTKIKSLGLILFILIHS